MTTFIIVNLIIAIVMDAMNEMNANEEEQIIEEIHSSEDASNLEIQKLRDDIKELKALIVSR